jgi:hypothetical protein
MALGSEIIDKSRAAVIAQFLPRSFKPEKDQLFVIYNVTGDIAIATVEWRYAPTRLLRWSMEFEQVWITTLTAPARIGWVFKSWIDTPSTSTIQAAVDYFLKNTTVLPPAPNAPKIDPYAAWDVYLTTLSPLTKGQPCYACCLGVTGSQLEARSLALQKTPTGIPMCSTCIKRHIMPGLVGEVEVLL